jgi:uncharacterized protein YjbJ (UPF0337 family)
MAEKWGKLTDDDLTQINGKREQFEGKIQERYGLAKDKVRTDVDTWRLPMTFFDFVRQSPNLPQGADNQAFSVGTYHA